MLRELEGEAGGPNTRQFAAEKGSIFGTTVHLPVSGPWKPLCSWHGSQMQAPCKEAGGESDMKSASCTDISRVCIHVKYACACLQGPKTPPPPSQASGESQFCPPALGISSRVPALPDTLGTMWETGHNRVSRDVLQRGML